MQGTSLVSTANQFVGMLGGISTLIGCRDTVSREFNIFNSHNEMMDVMDATSCDLHGMHRASSAVLSEVSYFPDSSHQFRVFKFFLTWSEGLRTEDVTPVQFVKPPETNCHL